MKPVRARTKLAAMLLAVLAPVSAHAHGGEWVLYVLAPFWIVEAAMLLHMLLTPREEGRPNFWPVAFLVAAAAPWIFASYTAPYQEQIDSPLWFMQNFFVIQAVLLCGAPAVWVSFSMRRRKLRGN